MEGIRNLELDLPSQVEFNRRKNLTQDAQLQNISSQINQLLEQAPAGFLPKVYYGLTRGADTYRFGEDAEIELELTGTAGTAFELYSNAESSSAYIPAVVVKQDDTTVKVIIRGDYREDASSFNAVNMTTGNVETVTITDLLVLDDASSLSDYSAAQNPQKQVTVLNNLETNSHNIIFASLDLNSDGIFNWIEIGNYVNGVDGTSIYAINQSNYTTILSTYAKPGDNLLFTTTFNISADSYAIGDVARINTLTPLSLTVVGNIRGQQGANGQQGTPGQDGTDGATPYIQNDYWYIDGTNTGVKALGTDGTNGQNGQSFQMQSGLYSTPDNWGQSGNVDPDSNSLLQLPTLPTTGITGKGYVVYDPLTTPLAPFYDLYYANDNDVAWTILHPFSGIAGQDGTDGATPYISGGTWWINGVNTGVSATGPQGPTGPTGPAAATYSFDSQTGVLTITTP